MNANYYYSKEKCDWRLCVSSNGFSFLELVGDENIKGTFKYKKKYLKKEGLI
jgi:hypothetical protein